jgi:hypothetical protein
MWPTQPCDARCRVCPQSHPSDPAPQGLGTLAPRGLEHGASHGGGDIVIDSDPPGAASFDVEKIDHLYHSSTILHSSILRAVATAAWRLYSLCVNRTIQYHVADADATLC